MTHPYDWHRKDALLRAKVAGATHLLVHRSGGAHSAELARRRAALKAAEEALRVHQMNKPQQENDQ